MPWWGWVLVWTVLVLGGGAVLVRLAWRVVRAGGRVLEEAGLAADRLAAVADQLERVGGREEPVPEPAVFADPGALRAERVAASRARRRRR